MKKNKAANEKSIAEFVEKKLARIEKFYRYGLSQAGWNKYSYINVEFDNQIICKKKTNKDRQAELLKQQKMEEEVSTTEVTE